MAKATSKKSSSSAKSTPSGKIKVGVDKDSSVSIREIENGFLVSENGYTGKGNKREWYNKEYFSKTNPLKGIISGAGNGGGLSSGGSMKFGGKK